MKIVITYSTIDRFRERRVFATLVGAQRYAHRRVGPHPEIGYTFGYAVSSDGVGKVEAQGVSLDALFPPPQDAPGSQDGTWDDRRYE